MKKEYKEAFSEISEILKLMPDDLKCKIPEEFKNIIEMEKSEEYFPEIKEPIEEIPLKKETIIVLGLIYRDFLCSLEEKQNLYEQERQEFEKINQELEEVKENINYNDMLKNISKVKSENFNSEEENVEKQITTISKQKWYKKILDLFKKIFQ